MPVFLVRDYENSLSLGASVLELAPSILVVMTVTALLLCTFVFLVFNGSIEQHNYRSTCGARFDTYALELKAAQRAFITVIIQRLPAFLREGEARATEL